MGTIRNTLNSMMETIMPNNSASEWPVSELENSINGLENSIFTFESTLKTVFSDKEMTPEQKEKSEQILSEKRKILAEMKRLLAEVTASTNELNHKNKELSVYNNADKIAESPEMTQKIDDLQKRILEIEEQQSILLKDFRLLSEGNRVNDKLSAQEIEKLKTITTQEFLTTSREKRLQAVTIGNILPENIINGSVKEVEINFSFQGSFNRQLYLSTTAGMIFPAEVREVSVNGEKFFRSGLEGEFFTENGKRLVIRDETKISIETLETTENLGKNFASKIDANKYSDAIEKEIALFAEKKNIPADIAILLLKNDIQNISDENIRRAVLEDAIADIDRKKWYFYRETNQNAVMPDGKLRVEFLSYLSEWNQNVYRSVAQKIGYTDEEILKNTFTPVARDYSRGIDMSKVMSAEISQEEINRIRSIKKFQPNSPDAVMLFRIATKIANLPEDWAKNEKLHSVLARESNGKVGVLNYTIKSMGLDQFYARANASSAHNPIGAKSTASGLGQLLLSNVDKYYPDGRKGIGDPINEAVGFIKYIADRYGNPDIAYQMYGKIGSYTHPTKWPQHKWFREWY